MNVGFQRFFGISIDFQRSPRLLAFTVETLKRWRLGPGASLVKEVRSWEVLGGIGTASSLNFCQRDRQAGTTWLIEHKCLFSENSVLVQFNLFVSILLLRFERIFIFQHWQFKNVKFWSRRGSHLRVPCSGYGMAVSKPLSLHRLYDSL